MGCRVPLCLVWAGLQAGGSWRAHHQDLQAVQRVQIGLSTSLGLWLSEWRHSGGACCTALHASSWSSPRPQQ